MQPRMQCTYRDYCSRIRIWHAVYTCIGVCDTATPTRLPLLQHISRALERPKLDLT